MSSDITKGTLLVFLLVLGCSAVSSYTSTDGSVSFPYSQGARRLTTLSNELPSPPQSFLDATNDKDPAAGVYKIIGGHAMNKPCCVSWGPGRVDCFIRSKQSNVHHWYKDGATYYSGEEWENLSGVIIGEIDCVSRVAGIIDVMVVGTNNALFVKTYNKAWSGWASKGGRIMEVPSCTRRTDTIINCILRGGQNSAYHIGAVAGKWTNYDHRKGSLQAPLVAMRRTDGILDIFGSGSNNHLFHMYWNGKWSGWSDVGGVVQGRPCAFSMDGKRIDTFVLGMGNQLMHLAWDGTKWLAWEDLGGFLQDVPSCVYIETSIHCFGTGPRSYLYRKSFVDGKWSDWISSYGAFLDSPSCVVSNAAKKEVSCYIRAFTREIVELVYTL